MDKNGKRNLGWSERHEVAAQAVYERMIAAGIPCEKDGRPNWTAIVLYALQQTAKDKVKS